MFIYTHTLGILKCLFDQSYKFKLVNAHTEFGQIPNY